MGNLVTAPSIRWTGLFSRVYQGLATAIAACRILITGRVDKQLRGTSDPLTTRVQADKLTLSEAGNRTQHAGGRFDRATVGKAYS